MNENRKENVAAAMLGISVAVILWITILSRETQANSVMFLHPFHFLLNLHNIFRSGLVGNTLGNIALFIPLGILMPETWKWAKPWYRTASVAFAFSLTMEGIQLLTRRGCFDLDDLILNTIGAILGYGVVSLATKILRIRLDKAN